VLIGGCHPGDCHYESGNYKARRRVAIIHHVLGTLGLGPDRVWLRWISASEGKYFADTVTEMVAAIREMGPSTLHSEWSI
jgi:F420-non-reducing hydrogenase iron-sulfur subunit